MQYQVKNLVVEQSSKMKAGMRTRSFHFSIVNVLGNVVFIHYDNLLKFTARLFIVLNTNFFRCKCRGHSKICDRNSGRKCECQNRTRTPENDDATNQVRNQHNYFFLFMLDAQVYLSLIPVPS